MLCAVKDSLEVEGAVDAVARLAARRIDVRASTCTACAPLVLPHYVLRNLRVRLGLVWVTLVPVIGLELGAALIQSEGVAKVPDRRVVALGERKDTRDDTH